MTFQAFISYASEDEVLATELAGALKSRGFSVWYAPLVLRVGSQLLQSIDAGLREARAGIPILSPSFLRKPWPRYELDALMRQWIEANRMLLPIWHGVSKEAVEALSPGLAGVFALRSDIGLPAMALKLASVLSEEAPTLASAPSWEDPLLRFLNGRGELVSERTRAFHLWDAVVRMGPELFPIHFCGQLISRSEVLIWAAQSIATNRVQLCAIYGETLINLAAEECKLAGIELRQLE